MEHEPSLYFFFTRYSPHCDPGSHSSSPSTFPLPQIPALELEDDAGVGGGGGGAPAGQCSGSGIQLFTNIPFMNVQGPKSKHSSSSHLLKTPAPQRVQSVHIPILELAELADEAGVGGAIGGGDLTGGVGPPVVLQSAPQVRSL